MNVGLAAWVTATAYVLWEIRRTYRKVQTARKEGQ